MERINSSDVDLMVDDGKKLDQTVGLGFGLAAPSTSSDEQNSTLLLNDSTGGEQLSEDTASLTSDSNGETHATETDSTLQSTVSAAEAELSEVAPSVTTDKDDYAPGETATITTTGFDVGASVTFEVDHVSDAGGDDVFGTVDDTIGDLGGKGHGPWTVTDGGDGDLDKAANGTIITEWYVNPDDSLNERFLLTATDAATNLVASTSFTDAPIVVDVSISSSMDDAEERTSGKVKLSSSDLELVDDLSKNLEQMIGLRFVGLNIPQGAIIDNVYIQFQVDETTKDNDGDGTLDPVSLTIKGEANDDATAFSNVSGNISSRPTTTEYVDWAPPAWLTKGEAGPDQQTPNLKTIVQELVNRQDWTTDSPIAFIITGSGEATAESFDGSAAPLLHIEYTPNVNEAPTAPTANDDDDGPGADFATDENTSFITASVLDNDTDPDQPVEDLFVLSFNTTGTAGLVSDNGGGTFNYDPNGQFEYLAFDKSATDRFTYTVSDGNGGTDTATVTVTVTGANDLPTATDNSYTVNNSAAEAVIGNALTDNTGAGVDSDPDTSDTLTVTAQGNAAGSAGGLFTIDATGAVTFNPNGDFNDLADNATIDTTLTYEISDGNGGTDTAIVTVTVTGNESQTPPSTPPTSASFVQTIDATKWALTSTDPAGIVYLPYSNTLLVSDSEINEIPKHFQGENLFEIALNGTLLDTQTTLIDVPDPNAFPVKGLFSDEPTGITYNPDTGHYFISDDTGSRGVYEWDGSSNADFDNGGLSFLKTSDFGFSDPEGVTYDTDRGLLYMADGANEKVVTFDPGQDRIFFNDDDPDPESFSTSNLGVSDPEGIAYDPVFDLLYIIGRASDNQVTQLDPGANGVFDGASRGSDDVLTLIEISAANVSKGAGLAIAPSSDNPDGMSLWVVDRGSDNVNDGEVHELSFDGVTGIDWNDVWMA